MRTSKTSAFTLVEVMVAIAILAILVALIGEIFSAATTSTNLGTKHLSADSQARLVFDRMGDDFANMVKRKDVDSYFLKQPGNDTMFFFSQAPGYSDSGAVNPSTTSLVGYRISPITATNPTPQLQRLGKQLDCDGIASGTVPGSMVFLNPAAAATFLNTLYSTIVINWPTTVSATSTDADYHVLGDGVFRLEFSFLENTEIVAPTTGAITVTSPYVDPPNPTAGSTPALGTYPLQFTPVGGGITTVTGIVVTIAILDTASRKIAPDPTLANLITALADTPNTPPLLATTPSNWNTTIEAPGFAQLASLPVTTAGQVRTYQRTFYFNIPPNTTLP